MFVKLIAEFYEAEINLRCLQLNKVYFVVMCPAASLHLDL